MLKKIVFKLRERSFKAAARRWLVNKYGRIFTWSAVLRLGGASDEHVFAAMAQGMQVVCENVYFERSCKELTDEQRTQLDEAVFCLTVFPAGTDKLLIVPQLKSEAIRDWYSSVQNSISSITLVEIKK